MRVNVGGDESGEREGEGKGEEEERGKRTSERERVSDDERVYPPSERSKKWLCSPSRRMDEVRRRKPQHQAGMSCSTKSGGKGTKRQSSSLNSSSLSQKCSDLRGSSGMRF